MHLYQMGVPWKMVPCYQQASLRSAVFFVNSPSDDVPVLSNQKKDEEKDKMYQPPKHSNALDDEAPEQIYGSDGEELTNKTEYGCELVRFDIYTSNPELL